jgi:hypothetical protein
VQGAPGVEGAPGVRGGAPLPYSVKQEVKRLKTRGKNCPGIKGHICAYTNRHRLATWERAAQFIVFKKDCSASCHAVFCVYFSYRNQATVRYMVEMILYR